MLLQVRQFIELLTQLVWVKLFGDLKSETPASEYFTARRQTSSSQNNLPPVDKDRKHIYLVPK